MARTTYILTAACPDRAGIVAAVSGFLADRPADIIEAAHPRPPCTHRVFLRPVFQPAEGDTDRAALGDDFRHVATRFSMSWALNDRARRARVLIMCSKQGHCLNDLLFRYRTGSLKVDIPAIVSNHRTHEREAAFHGVPFVHLPVTRDNKAEQEAAQWELVQSERIDLVVLARYMQVLSADLCDKLAGRCINIHHSFLPGFKGARPYRQAYNRGVKLIGATAHYVTADLDEGPIIEQAVERVDHTDSARELAAVGRDIESVVLARAVKRHIEHRVLVNGRRTVVFR